MPADVLEDPTPATELGPDGLAALKGIEVPDDLDLTTWWIVTETDARLVLLRPLAAPQDLGAGDVPTHELLAIEKVDAPNVPPPGWMLTRSTTCAIAVPGAGSASVTLDPQAMPDPAAASVALLVTERACASGQLATDRVRVAGLIETDVAVEVVVVVDPMVGGATCQGNPPTPFVLELATPLGERVLLDASVLPARGSSPRRRGDRAQLPLSPGTLSVTSSYAWSPGISPGE